jgi:putative ABC transport system permease protein
MSTISTSFSIALAYLREKKLATALNVLLLSLGVGTIIALVLLLSQAEERMQKDAASVDLVIGAKGSPMQLILSSIFQVDVPTGNILMRDAQPVVSSRMVKRAVPLALGDSHKGFRIVGTTPSYVDLYQGSVVTGRLWDQPLEAVIGTDVSRATGLVVGSKFAGTHGLSESGSSEHTGQPYTVVGILHPTGNVMDRLILTDLASVWTLHDHPEPKSSSTKHEGHDGHGDHAGHGAHPANGKQGDANADREVTAYLIQYATPLAAVSFPRTVNATSSMQAASPAMESARLFQLVGVGVNALKGFAVVMMLCAGLGIFIGLMNALDERRADLALLRVLGASPAIVVLSTLFQGAALGCMGVILGVGMGHLAAQWIGAAYAASQRVAIGGGVWVQQEWWIAGGALALAVVASLVPAWRAYRESTPELLASR